MRAIVSPVISPDSAQLRSIREHFRGIPHNSMQYAAQRNSDWNPYLKVGVMNNVAVAEDLTRNRVLATNSNFLITISMQPDIEDS